LMNRSRCFWFIHDAAWTWVSTCQSTSHTQLCTENYKHTMHRDAL